MYFKGQKFLVAGISVSGESSARFLLERGADVYIYDDVITEKVSSVMEELSLIGAHIVTADGCREAAYKCDVLVLSPGIPIDTALPVSFRKQGKLIIGEEELGAIYLKAAAVAVTGTNGKTTTVTMLDEIFRANAVKSVACGNNGNPLIKQVDELSYNDVAVVEVSSFQLETLSSLRPHVAVVTNISEDHLNRHYNMENYVYLKSKLVRMLRESGYAILNFDDPVVRSFSKSTKGKAIFFSARSKVEGAYLEDGALYYNGEKYLDVAEMTVGGVHNIYNALACIAVSAVMGLDKIATANAIRVFKGVSHRMERVREVNGVTYIDDSKGTNVDASVKAAQSMKSPTVILLGGKDKGEDYAPLFEGLNQSPVIHAIIYGENRFKMLNAALKSNFTGISMCSEFNTAVHLAQYIAKQGQCVLLSPASASFDGFSNFEERGDAFKKIVAEIDEIGS